jgi:hypothetical protein
MSGPVAIAEVSGVDPRVIPDSILASAQPLVLRGLVAGWPLVRAGLRSAQDAAAHVRGFYQGAPVRVLIGPPDQGGRFFYNDEMSGFNFRVEQARLDAVLDAVLKAADDPRPAAVYVGSTTIDDCLPGFRASNDIELGERKPLVSIWLGNRSRVAAHQDIPDNLACVAAGRRRFTLFPPGQLRNLYIGPLDYSPAGQAISLVDFAQPDGEKFPRFAQALEHAQVAELGPGDAIFIPSLWWHHIEALDPFNVLVNYWWRRAPAHMESPINALMLAMMSLRDLPEEQRAHWQEIFRHYVFEPGEETSAHVPEHARGVLGKIDAEAAGQLRALLLKRLGR